jgi:polyhydroxybutyrate depolymerase
MKGRAGLMAALLLCHCSGGSPPAEGVGANGGTMGSGGAAAGGAPAGSPPVGGGAPGASFPPGAGGAGLAAGGTTISTGGATGGATTVTGGAAGAPIGPQSAGGGGGAAGTPSSTGGAGGAAPMGGPAMPSSGCGMANPPASGSKTIDVDGTERQYIVTVPMGYDPGRPYRLVVAWHGLGGTAMQIASNYYGLTSRSGGSAIFIAPQGLPGTGQQAGFAAWANTNDTDITFTRKLLDWAKSNYCVDVKRVFSIGMSNGGMMSNVVGCELGDAFRAIVAMSGGGPKGYAMTPCKGQIAVWISHGNTDNNVPFSYGEASRDYWAKTNHCGTATAPVMPGTCVEYQGCDPGYPVQFCEFDGGHMVPSFAGEAGWNFFARF